MKAGNFLIHWWLHFSCNSLHYEDDCLVTKRTLEFTLCTEKCLTLSESTVRSNEVWTTTKTHNISWTIFVTMVPCRKKLKKQLQYLFWFTVPTVCSISCCLWVCLTCTFEAITTNNCRYQRCNILHSFLYIPLIITLIYMYYFSTWKY
jgi:hypothetical protein